MKLKLNWEQNGDSPSHTYYTYQYFNGAISMLVQRVMNEKSEHAGKWELVVGFNYVSKNKGIYFNTAERAMLQGEKIMMQIIKNLEMKLELGDWGK